MPSTHFDCSICYETIEGEPAALPCCGAPPVGSSLLYCRRCLEIICEQALGGSGRCPTCRGFLSLSADGELEVAQGFESCIVCNQARPVGERIRQGPLCAACGVGVRRPLLYECENGCRQLIPHPMYRYQEEPSDFGHDTWACRNCKRQTHWRIEASCLGRVPPDDAPVLWGRRDEWLARVREQRRRELVGAGSSRRPEQGSRMRSWMPMLAFGAAACLVYFMIR